MFAPLKVIFGPITPFSGLGLTLTKGPSASALLDWTAANWVCRVFTCDWSSATCFFRAAISSGTPPAAASADTGVREARTPTDTTEQKIISPQARHRLLFLSARDPLLIESAVILPLTSLVFATRTVARLSTE